MRLFVAADVPDAAREAIAAAQKRIASALSEKEREPFPAPLANRSSELRRTRRSAARAVARLAPLRSAARARARAGGRHRARTHHGRDALPESAVPRGTDVHAARAC